MDLSGAMGYSLLESPLNNITKKKIKVLLFSDIHDGVSYCDARNSSTIAEFLKSRKGDSKILLEESTQKEVKLKSLWPNSKHTQELKKLAYMNDDIISFDIRPLLVPFSWELINPENEFSDESFGNITLSKYLHLIEEFFNKKSLAFTKYVNPELLKITFQKKKVNIHYKELYRNYNNFKKTNIQLLDKKLYEIDHSVLEKINDLISNIMEWYIIILILNSQKNIIIHTGLAHSSKIILMLTKYYKFTDIEYKGINFFNELGDKYINSKPKACVFFDSNSKFQKKYIF